jgi:hypothetical protein
MEDSSKTTSAGTEWTMRSRYETTDGDRVTLLYGAQPNQFAVSYSYAWPDAPQFIEYTSRLDAHKAFAISLQNATRRGVVVHGEG